MTTLHGKEIKVGDMVWSIIHRWDKVRCIKNGLYPIVTTWNSSTIDGKYHVTNKYPTLFWQEMILTPKPEPTFEWQWCFKAHDKWRTTNKWYENESAFKNSVCMFKSDDEYFRIEQSKREVK